MKTLGILLAGALIAVALMYAFHWPTQVESNAVAESPPATVRSDTVSETASPTSSPQPTKLPADAPAAVAADPPASRSERIGRPVAAEVFEQSLASSPEGAPKQPSEVMHERFSREKADPNWRPNVEPQVQGYLKTEEMMKWIDFVSLECREATCEIFAASPSVEQNAESMRRFQDRFAAMQKESWWAGYGFQYPSVSFTTAPDGRVIMIAHLSTLKSR